MIRAERSVAQCDVGARFDTAAGPVDIERVSELRACRHRVAGDLGLAGGVVRVDVGLTGLEVDVAGGTDIRVRELSDAVNRRRTARRHTSDHPAGSGWDVEQHGVAAGCDRGEDAVGEDSGADREAHAGDRDAEAVEDALPRCRACRATPTRSRPTCRVRCP